jgi:ABC-type amino acid transport substrate-binding protein
MACANRYFPFVHWVAHFVRRCGNLPGTLAWSARSNDASLRQPDDLDTLWSGHRLGQRLRLSEFWRGAGVLREDSHSLVAPFSSLAAALIVAGGFVWAARSFDRRVLKRESNPYLSFQLDPDVTRGVNVSLAALDSAEPLPQGLSVLARIQQNGELRVGYNSGIIPFCYLNSSGDLVGYDVAYAYQLARDLNVRLRLIPFQWTHLASNLGEGRFDIAMAGIYVTEDRLLQFKASSPYFQSPLALFMPRERAGDFTSRAKILERNDLRIGVFDDPVLIPRLKRTFPNAEIVLVADYRQVPDFSKIDAAIWTFAQAEALAAAHPDLIAVAPSDVGNPYLLAYLMPPGAEEFEKFISYWLSLKKSDGFEARQRAYWIERVPRADSEPRWSVLRNVFGWGVPAAPVGPNIER